MPYLSTERLADMQAKTRQYYLDSTGRELWQHETKSELYKVHKESSVCSHFGCGVHLSLLESLAGNRCINHSRVLPRPDVTKMVSF